MNRKHLSKAVPLQMKVNPIFITLIDNVFGKTIDNDQNISSGAINTSGRYLSANFSSQGFALIIYVRLHLLKAWFVNYPSWFPEDLSVFLGFLAYLKTFFDDVIEQQQLLYCINYKVWCFLSKAFWQSATFIQNKLG